MVSVVIPTLNEETSLAQTLEALLAAAGHFEVIVVDGQSADRTPQIAARYCRTLSSPAGRGIQMNRGAEEASGDALLFLLDRLIPTLKPIKEFAATPTGWNAYFDDIDKYFIRYPAEWDLLDYAPGLPTSIGKETTALRLEADDAAVADEAAARSWVETATSGATILSVQPVERDGHDGFSVAYRYTNADGDALSGLAVLLNGPDAKLNVANVHFLASGIDLNNLGEQPDERYATLAEVMSTFTIFSDLNAQLGAVIPPSASG